MIETNQQAILSTIANIKVSGIVTMAYWLILETGDSIYFVQTGSAVGVGVGSGLLVVASVVSDIVASHDSKQAVKQNLDAVLNGSMQHFVFSKNTLAQIQIKKGIIGGTIVFPNGKEKSWSEAGIVRLKLSGKNFKLFNEMVQRKLLIQ